MRDNKSQLYDFSADDILKHAYPPTIIAVVKDLDKQIDEYRQYLDTLSDPKERAEIAGNITEQTRIAVALLEYYVSYTVVGPVQRDLCIKYKVDHTY